MLPPVGGKQPGKGFAGYGSRTLQDAPYQRPDRPAGRFRRNKKRRKAAPRTGMGFFKQSKLSCGSASVTAFKNGKILQYHTLVIPQTKAKEKKASGTGRALKKSKSLFKIWNFGVENAKILLYRLQKSPKSGFLWSIDRKKPQFEQTLRRQALSGCLVGFALSPADHRT
jgi:hypothetical protein